MRIELENVNRRFGRVNALNGLALTIASGRRVALIGPNGSGKSTLTRVLAGMLGYAGRIRLDGLCPWSDRDRVASRLAYVPQTPPQLPATAGEIADAVARARGLGRHDVSAAATALGLDLAAVARRPVRALSGGMKQKLMLALAFAGKTDLLLLDEPTASLDANSRLAFYRFLRERAGDATLLLCSHRLDEVRHLVEHVVVLEEGRLAWSGPLAEYLRGAAHSLIEVQVAGLAATAWLDARGFARDAGGDWSRVFPRARGVAVLRDILASLDGAVEAVRVRDLDTLDGSFVPGGES